MSAINALKSSKIRLQVFSKGPKIRKVNNFFQKKRRKYLQSVIGSEKKVMIGIEQELLEKLRRDNKIILNSSLEKMFIKYLRRGVPLNNVLLMVELQSKLLDGNKHLPHNPRFRKKNVLETELQLLEVQYESLRLARKKALEEGLNDIAKDIAKEISFKAKSIASYKKLFSKLIE